MGNSQRNKGAAGERELVKVLNEYGLNTHRGHVFYHEPDVIGLPGIHIEVKRVEKLDLKKAIDQAVEESLRKDHGTPCVFHRVNRGKWKVTMSWLDFWDYFFIYQAQSWDYLHVENGMVTTLLSEWIEKYKNIADIPVEKAGMYE